MSWKVPLGWLATGVECQGIFDEVGVRLLHLPPCRERVLAPQTGPWASDGNGRPTKLKPWCIPVRIRGRPLAR